MAPKTRWQSSAKWTLVAVVAVIVVGGFGFYWFFLRGDTPDRASLPVRTSDTTAPAGEASGSPDGSWTVEQGEEVFVGYRVDELFAGDTIKKTAVGRTPAVTGTMTIVDGQVTEATFEADTTQLTSDQSRRDSYIKGNALQTESFPTATFTLVEPIALPTPLELNTPVEVQAVGDLTLHGVTQRVTIPLQAQWDGTIVDVAGGVTIAMADYDIDTPDTPVVRADDQGELELQLSFVRS